MPIWNEQFRPKELKDMVLDEDKLKYFSNIIKNKSIENREPTGGCPTI
jgi:hypothetical protein